MVTVTSDEEERAVVEAVVSRLGEEGVEDVDAVAGAVEAGEDSGADVGVDAVGEALVDIPVPTGIIWR